MKQFLKFTFASCLGFLLSFFTICIIVAIVIVATVTGFSSKQITVAPNSVLKIEFNGVLKEQAGDMSFFDAWSSTNITELGIHDIIKSIQHAKTDENIVGIWLQMDLFSAGNASISEIRDALVDFKESGKFIIAYGDNYTQQLYYLATVADKIFIHPSGTIELKGLASKPIFFKNALQKVGVDMQVVKVGDYKGAPEMYTNNAMSDENKAQTKNIINQLWRKMCTNIASERNISIEQIESLVEKSVMFAPTKSYVTEGLVDSLLYPDELVSYFKTHIDSTYNEEEQMVSYGDYIVLASQNKSNNNKIAVLYANGGIDDGDIEGIDSEELSKLLSETRKDSSIKAVVLRINSPGGSAFGAERIWRETSLFKGVKPLVVSMGDYAASGGYYIATQADSIFSNTETLTGSIGIFGIIPNFSKISEKFGITYDPQTTHTLADFPSFTRDMTTYERNILERYITDNYQLFLHRCSEGRSITKAALLPLAGGRVWTGSDALTHGLVDKIGGLQQAIQSAARMASITSYEVEHLPKKKTVWESMLEDTTIQIQSLLTKNIPLHEYRLIRSFIDNKTRIIIQARMEENSEIW